MRATGGLNSSLAFTAHRPNQKPKLAPPLTPRLNRHKQYQHQHQQRDAEADKGDSRDSVSTRRDLVVKLASAVAFGAFSSIGVEPPTVAQAADAASGPTIWNSGKAPKVPGQKPKDKNDTSGTRKDGNFLRSIADCKNQCENTTGPDGFSRSKEECLSDCQDICCKTYEQCTFAIVPRI
eukprot:CAMPEP_0178730782 /NCGR_PEP_ID=MMETSP0699-20121125/29703_1 /TAXON_ID=265572 /ORGANISM="Extubocellulus spinifer, Strain CCMP396" /LENGTH=178 /DNA_ID=CAMNT_0020382831 /DNA_START=66 /DNA_END=602 /DNA_ORIENTATION=-